MGEAMSDGQVGAGPPFQDPTSYPGPSGRLRRIPPGLKPTSGRSREDGLTHRAEPVLPATSESSEQAGR
jgi:hypothetical protein